MSACCWFVYIRLKFPREVRVLNPEVGQIVRHQSFGGNLVVKSVGESGVVVEFLPMSGEVEAHFRVPFTEVLPARELYRV